jgi:hypothetical protein
METTLPVGFKTSYIKKIASGYSESKALKEMDVDWMDFFELCAKDPDFRKDIENARKARAEVWVGKITDDVTSEEPLAASEIPAAKLRFEQLKFLAKADNPERYGEKGGGPSVQINMGDYSLLSPQDAIKVLNNDPFNKMVTIETTTTSKEEE